jgi:hypothetical protein
MNAKMKYISVSIVSLVLVIAVSYVAVQSLFGQSEQKQLDHTLFLPVVVEDAEDTVSDEVVTEDLDTSDWQTYTDDVAGFSFRYPNNWNVVQQIPETGDVRIQAPDSIYRAIEIGITSKSRSTSSAEIALASNLKRIDDAYGEKFASQFVRRRISVDEAPGYSVSNFPSGTHTIVTFSHEGLVYIATLVEGGDIGGGSPYETETAKEDEQVFYTVLSTLQFHSK